MRARLTLVLLMMFCRMHAQDIRLLNETEKDAIRRYTSHSRVMIRFRESATPEQKAAVIAKPGCFASWEPAMDLPSPRVTICVVRPGMKPDDAEWQRAMEMLRGEDAVRAVNPFLYSEKNDAYFGVTEKFHVKLKQPGDTARMMELARHARVKHEGEDPWMKGVHLFRSSPCSMGNALECAMFFGANGDFDYAEPVYLFNPVVTTNDTYFGYQWALENSGSASQGSGTPGADMSVTDAWTFTTGDSNTVIGLLDSGVDTLHPDLTGNLLRGYDATNQGSNGYPNLAYPEDGHGTCCAGILAAKGNNGMGIAGVCYDCRVLPVRVFYYQNQPLVGLQPWSQGDWMANAINWAASQGADVLSNSWGIPDYLIPILPGGSSVVETAIQTQAAGGRGGLGLPMFFSSGNDGGPPIWPGRLRDAISVNATSMCDERKNPGSCDGENWEGNWKDSLDIAAPGVSVIATDMQGANGFTNGEYFTGFNGTSAACPNAAGVMGLMLSLMPSLTLEQARRFMETSCDRTGGYNYNVMKANGTWSQELGYGRVNAYNALFAVSRGKENVTPVQTMTLFPNPNDGRFTLYFTLASNQRLRIQVTDMTGRILDEGEWKEYPAGRHVMELQPSLPSGTCWVNVKTESGTATRKMIVIRP